MTASPRVSFILITGLLGMLCSTSALAQDPAKPADTKPDATSNEMTAEQLKLNNEVSILLRSDKPDLDQALKKINEAISKGKRIDVLLLTLARVYQLRDECPKSLKLLDEIDIAPHDPRVPKKNISELKSEYIRQMRSRCSATLTVTCKQPDVKLSINDKPLVCGEKVKLRPGTYQIDALRGKQKYSFSKNLDEGTRHYNHTFVMPDPKKNQNKTIIINRQDPGFAYTRTTVAVASTLVVAGALTIWWHLSGEDADTKYGEYLDASTKSEARILERDVRDLDDTSRTAGYSAIGAWSIGAVASGIFYFLDAKNASENKKTASPSKDTTPKVSVSPTTDGGINARVFFRF